MKKKKKRNLPIFDSIRKPVAPPTRTIGESQPEERARPALRKIKHKKREETDD